MTELTRCAELLRYVAENLVDHPDAIEITERGAGRQDGEHVLELRVAQSDMGKVIGRGGRVAREIRALIRASGQRRGERVTVDILD